MNTKIKARLDSGFRNMQISMEQVGEKHIHRIKPIVEQAVKALWEKYEEHDLLESLSNTQASFGASYKIAPDEWTEPMEKAYEQFEFDKSELAELLYRFDDAHYCPDLLFTYDGKNFQWWH